MRKLLALIAVQQVIIISLVLPASSLTSQESTGRAKTKLTRDIISLNGERIFVVRDDYGVPHIFASSRRGAYYGGGYAIAQDRFYQLERFRRDARGEVAEIEGPGAFQRDLRARVHGNTEEEYRAIYNSLGDAAKQTYQAYTDGINLRMRECVAQGALPDEFARAGITDPAPWRVTDSIAISIMIAGRFGPGGGLEISNAEILKKLKARFGPEADAIFNDLFYLNDPNAPVTIPDNGANVVPDAPRSSKRVGSAPALRLSGEMVEEVSRAVQEADIYEYAEKHDLPRKLGSFCWVLGPSRTSNGNPIVVGGPQLGFSTPSIAHEIHYSAPDFNVVGMGIAGIPGVIIGHNDHIAWSLTSGRTDMRDIFVEKLNPRNKSQYLHKGKYLDLQRRTEVIKIKGEEPRTIQVNRTIHGSVAGSDIKPMEQANELYVLANSYAGNELKTFEAINGINSARRIEDIPRFAEMIYTSNNLFVATIDGDIGYWHCGKPPIRAPGHNPRLPVAGTGEFDWLGRVPFSKMPQVINPRQGYIVNWNNKPAPWWNHGDTPIWGQVYHMPRIETLIKSRAKSTFDDALAIAQDIATHDPYGERLKPYLLLAVDKTGAASRDSRVKEAVANLRAWNNHAVDGTVAKTIYDAWFAAVIDLLFGQEFSDLKSINLHTGLLSFAYRQYIDENFFLHSLEGASSPVPPSRDYFKGKDKSEVLVEALTRALDLLEKRLGPKMNLWGYKQGAVAFSQLAPIPDVERATYTLAVEVSKPLFRSVSVLPPGQHASPRSPHYGDQRDLAASWRYKPIYYKRGQFDAALFH
jgi:penicillin amidase